MDKKKKEIEQDKLTETEKSRSRTSAVEKGVQQIRDLGTEFLGMPPKKVPSYSEFCAELFKENLDYHPGSQLYEEIARISGGLDRSQTETKKKTPDRELLRLYSKIKPVQLCKDGNLREITGYKYENGGYNLFKTGYTLRERSFVWSPVLGKVITGLVKICDITTEHEFSAPNVFCPSIEEVIVQIPKKYLKKVRAFETSRDDECSDSFGKVCIDGGYHLAITRLYK